MPSVGEKQHPHKHTEHTLSGTKGEYSNEKFLSIFCEMIRWYVLCVCVCLCVRQKASHEPTNRTEIGLVLYSSCMKVLFIIADIWEKDNTNNIAQQIFCFFKHSLRVFIDFSMSFAHFFPSFRAHWDLVIIVTCFFPSPHCINRITSTKIQTYHSRIQLPWSNGSVFGFPATEMITIRKKMR